MENAELIKALKEDAEWAHANEWETPITLGDHLDAAVSALRAQGKYHIGDVNEMIPQWISVEDRLPNEGANVLVYIPFRGSHLHYVSYMESGLWYVPTMYGRSSLNDITHWQPLPQPPQKG